MQAAAPAQLRTYDTERPVNVGIIGYGYRVENLFNLLTKIAPKAVFYAVCDPDVRRVELAKRINPAVVVYEDHNKLSEDPKIEWVMIGSWNNFHREHTLAAFKNRKHVFCEKPLATTVDDCIAMKRAWLETNKECKFIIGFVLRFSPFYQKIREIVQSGRIGKVVSMEFNETLSHDHGGYIMGDWRRKTDLSGGHLLEKTCHDFDLVNWILDTRAKKVASFGGLDIFTPQEEHRMQTLGHEFTAWGGLVMANPFTPDKDIVDNQVAIIEYENGTRSTFHTNCQSALKERRMYINGTLGTIRGDVITGKLEMKLVGYEQPIEDYTNEHAKGGHGGADSIIAQAIADAIYLGSDPVCGIDEGLKAAITCLSVDVAMKHGRVLDLTDVWANLESQFKVE